MVRASASSSSKTSSEPDFLERRRLKKLAFSKNLLSETPANTHSPLSPSKTVLKHHGKDILRKSQRKNRYLFSFPGLLAPIANGGKIGELKDLGTRNPILYLQFPQGQMKLFGTIAYPKNRYLTLQFSRGGKNVMCEDYFDSMIVFSEAFWIGTKEQNPEESRLDFPKQFIEGQGQQVEYDFKGGAGGTSVITKQVVHKNGNKYEQESPETEVANDLSDDQNNSKDLKETTPIRHSERTAGKKFKFTEVSSGDDSVESVVADMANEEGEEEKKVECIPSSTMVLDVDKEYDIKASNENSHCNRGSLVQPTIHALFNKAKGKKKAKEKTEGLRKRGNVNARKKTGTGTEEKKKIYEVEDDDIEEFSSSTQDSEGSDEDWAA